MSKIVHLLSTGGYSGAEKIVLEIIENDLENKHIYVAPKGDIENILIERNIDYYLYSSKEELKSFIKNNDVDVLHCHDYKASILAAGLKSKYKISHIHHNPKFASKINIKSLIYLFSVLTYIDKVIYVSKIAKDEYVFNKVIKNKSCVISNWINKDERLCEADYEKDIDILFVGRLVEAKNPGLFLDILNNISKKRPNINATIVGDGELKPFIQDKINKLKLEENINFLGYRNNPEKYMKKSKVFLSTSSWEGFGLAVLEAMLNESVVVTTKVGGLKEIVKNEYNGFFIEDIEKTSDKIIDIIENFENYKNIRDNAIKSLERFDIKRNTKQIYNIYNTNKRR